MNPTHNIHKQQPMPPKLDFQQSLQQQQQLTARSLNIYDKNLYEFMTERNEIPRDPSPIAEIARPRGVERFAP